MTYDMFWVICVQVQDDERSERFILASANPQLPPESVNVSLPLIESDIRKELEKSGLRVEQVDSYIQHPRWTPENRPLIDTSKPATTGVVTETVSG